MSVFKRIISVILCCTIIFIGSAALYVTSAEDVSKSRVPIVYIEGQGMSLYRYAEDGSSEKVYPVTIPDGYIQQVAKENIDVFAKAFFTQKWDEFERVLHEAIAPITKEIILDENGESTNGVTGKKNNISHKKYNNNYNSKQFRFKYDWRLDPLKTAEVLHKYIEEVLAVTGEEKVALIGRCLGANIATSYMKKYDGEYVSDFIIYASAHNGSTICSKSFCGEIKFDDDAVERYVYDYKLFEDEVINQLIQASVTLFNKTYGLKITCAAINNVIKKNYLLFFPELVTDLFSTYPSYWSMVNDEDYEKAKEVFLYNKDKEQWSNFIKIIDNYHYNVQLTSNEDFLHYKEKGIDVFNITKYGFQAFPASADGGILSDSLCSVYDSSMGVTTTKIDKTFSRKYMKNAEKNGTIKYISPDKQIDASTCTLPDNTWFIKNLEHKKFPDIVDELIYEMINNDSFTVFSNEDFPQYLVYDETSSIVPLTADNMNTTERYNNNFFSAFAKLFESLYILIKRQIESKII